MKILIASKNKGKIKEFKGMVEDLEIEVKTLYDYENFPDIEETGTTFRENSLIKAKAGYEKSGLITISDDSGLEVDFLNGAPGVYSARYGGEGLTDSQRVDLLLKELKDVPKEKRGANFKTSVILYNGKESYHFEGTWKGEILEKTVGNKGFGYDPIFFDPILGKTAAELDKSQKSKVSHRGKAMKKLLERLPEILK